MCKNTCAEKGAAAREALRSAAKDAGAGNKVGKHAPLQPVSPSPRHCTCNVECQMLQAVCSHMACAQRCAQLELHAKVRGRNLCRSAGSASVMLLARRRSGARR